MRRIVTFHRVSADGYFSGPDGSLDWVVADPAVDEAAMSGPQEIDTFLFGRRTYEMFESFWPHALKDPDSTRAPHGGELSDAHHAMARSLNDTPKLVFSRSLKRAGWNNSRLLHELDPTEIEGLKQQPGGDMLVLGSGSLVSQLSQHGLIDEYQMVVSPIFLGAGQRLLGGVTKHVALELIDAQTFSSGNIMLRYARRA